MTKKTNIDDLGDKLKKKKLELTSERIEGSHYNLTVKKKGKDKTQHFVDAIKENATKKECEELFKKACKELGVK